MQPRPRGPRLTIVTNAGGPGVLATDALIGGGGELAPLAAETVAALDRFLPAHWSHGNPIDVLGDAGPDRYAKALEVAARDPNTDGLLVVLTPQAMTDPTQTAEGLKGYARLRGQARPGQLDGRGRRRGRRGDPPEGRHPDLRLSPTPPPAPSTPCGATATTSGASTRPPPGGSDPTRTSPTATGPRALIQAVRASGRALLTEAESKQLLALYGIPTVATHVARDEGQAVASADEIGYPVVLKLFSETITHKTDVGGVQLNLGDADAVRGAYRDDRGGGARARRRRAFPGRDRPADGQAATATS